MTENSDADDLQYAVVVNDEEQYSIWPVDQELPSGWRRTGTTGSKDECLAHIDEVWTDMRPLSLRRWMAEHADDPVEELDLDDDGPSLVDRLCTGSHPVTVSVRADGEPLAVFAEAVERGYVLLRFTDTQGGTELGVKLDRDRTRAGSGDIAAGIGEVLLVGSLILDFEAVRCVARIDLATLSGQGHLERVGGG